MDSDVERCPATFIIACGDLDAIGFVVAFPTQRCFTAAAAAVGGAGHRRGGRHHVLLRDSSASLGAGRREGTDGGNFTSRDGEERGQCYSLIVHVVLFDPGYHKYVLARF